MNITDEQERGLLELLENEPDEGHAYSDQDIAEQMRKYLQGGYQHTTTKNMKEKGAAL